MGKLVIAALIVIPFVALILWDKGDSNDSSIGDIRTAFLPKPKRLQEDIDAGFKRIELSYVKALENENPEIQQVTNKPKAIAQIRKAIGALEKAERNIALWQTQALPLLRSSAGARITHNPRFVEGVDKIINGDLPDKAEIEEPLAGLLPYVGVVRKMKGGAECAADQI